MNIFLKETNDDPVQGYTSTCFPGGEPHFKILNPEGVRLQTCHVTLAMQRFNYPLLACAVDAYRRIGIRTIELFLPYFPGARQDRVCNDGEALTARVYADMVNCLQLDQVVIHDPHSDVVPALINNCRVVPHGQLETLEGDTVEFLDQMVEGYTMEDDEEGATPAYEGKVVVISPDAGATKKVLSAIERSKYKDRIVFLQGSKIRDTQTGGLKGFDCERFEFREHPVIVMDDINCNGGTFLGLGKLLRARGAREICLFTTHCDHQKGLDNIEESLEYDQYATSNSQGDLVYRTSIVDQFDLFLQK